MIFKNYSNAQKITLNVNSMETIYTKRYGVETKTPPMKVASQNSITAK